MPDPALLHPVRVEVRIQTPHAVPITGAQVRIIGGDVEVIAVEADGVYTLALPRPGDYQLVVERFQLWGGYDHRTLRTTLFYVYTAAGPVLRCLGLPPGALSRVDFVEGGGPSFWLGVTLDYLWFTPVGYAPTYGNEVELLVDGDAGWGAVARALRAAQSTVHLTTWSYQPTTELERPSPVTDPDARAEYTVQDLLETRAAAGTRVRFLLWDAPFLRQPRDLRRAAIRGDDNFEALEQVNPTERPLLAGDEGLINQVVGNFQIGSYHQKTVVVDGRVGFCGGMNLRENDWDGRGHEAVDARRCRYDRDSDHRARVDAGELASDHAPRHDYVARIEGPAVAHLERNFQQRWNYLLEQGVAWSQYATAMADPPEHPPIRGGSQVQVIRTMPEPFNERGILDVHLRALRTARKLIYIEDQYFRSTHISDAIADTVRAFPGIHVIAVTLRSQADDLLAGGWSREAFDRIRRRLPGFMLHGLMVDRIRDGERSLVEIDIHAKLMIVDDLFLTVGSANINDRSFEFEGEINIAMVDAERVKRARLDIWREHLLGDPRLTGDIDGDVAIWREHAALNALSRENPAAAPRSRVFPFEPRSDRRRVTAHDVM